MKRKRVGRLLLGLFLSAAMIVTFIPTTGDTAYAYSGSWSLVDDEISINCEKDDETVLLDAEEQISINDEGVEDSSEVLTLEDFSYAWYQYDEDDEEYEFEYGYV